MNAMLPPAPPRYIDLADGGGSRRLQRRLQQVTLAAATVFITAWCVTLGSVAAVVSLAVAKHVLVAILVMGLEVDAPRAATRDT